MYLIRRGHILKSKFLYVLYTKPVAITQSEQELSNGLFHWDSNSVKVKNFLFDASTSSLLKCTYPVL
jgi:hypothetical protein